MNLNKLSKLFTFFQHVRFFDKKGIEPYHLFVIDGPASIAISKLIINRNTSLNLRFIASANFLTRLNDSDTTLKNYLVGWHLLTLMLGVIRFISLCIDMKRMCNVSEITRSSETECMVNQIKCNASLIKNVIVFNERSPFTTLAVSTAKSYGIATSCIQHGAVVENYFPIRVDRYFTWSDYYSKLLQQRAPGLKTICIGRLGYKTPVQPYKTEKKNNPLLILQPADVSITRDVLLSHFKHIIDACYSHFDEITLRPHPNDNIMHDIISHIGNRSFIVDLGGIDETLARHSITISLYSTVLLEAPHHDNLPVQYLESSYSSELMQRCELHAELPEVLTAILKKLKDKNYFNECLDKAKEFAENRMKPGDIPAFFEILGTANVDC